ncbi:alpha-L-fucosidase [Candidatus Poribacteria bacterium]
MIPRFGDGRDWFFEKRFGMFVHWGIYAVPAWQEQVMWRKNIPRKEYVKFAHQFNPTEFDPDEWLDLCEKAGMEYICLTTKHHDGFCMWDTKYTDFNIMNTSYKRDIVGMLADACHGRDFPLCFYYSCVDWHHPNYPNQDRHHELPGPEEGDEPDFEKYLEFLRNQVKELLTNYGRIHGLFWDINVPEHRDPSINEMIRSLQPGIMINDRGYDEGDYGTPERRVPDGRRFTKPTEACQSLGQHSWGYKEDEDFYADKLLMQSIDRVLAMGGNYLLNVGPKADGTIQDEFVQTLTNIGQWYHKVKEAFYDAEPASELTDNQNVMLTKKDNTLYVHLHKDPESTAVILKPIDVLPRRATLLNTGDELEARVDRGGRHWREKEYLRIRNLPVNKLTNTVMVIRLEFDHQLPSR